MGELLLGLLGFVAVVAIYFVPTWIMAYRDHPNPNGLFFLNLFAGWSGVGWLICLVWSFSERPSPSAQTGGVKCVECGSWNAARLPDGRIVCGECPS